MENIDLGDGEKIEQAKDVVEEHVMVGAPMGWRPPCPPESWLGYSLKGDAPKEEDSENPGGLNFFSFAAKYNAQIREYIGHFSSCGAKVVLVIDGEKAIHG